MSLLPHDPVAAATLAAQQRDVCLLEVAPPPASAPRGAPCSAVRLAFSYPLKLMLLSKLDSRRASAAPPPCTPLWVYLLSYGGGLLAGDAQLLSVRVQAGAACVLATQGATRVYHARRRGGGGEASPSEPPACVSLSCLVCAGALLALLPDPTVLFADAKLRQRQRIVLQPGGSLCLLDWVTGGREHLGEAGEAWAFSLLDSRTEIWQADADAPAASQHRMLTEAMRLTGGCAAAPLAHRMGRAHVLGVLVLAGPRCEAQAGALLAELGGEGGAGGRGFTQRSLERARGGGSPFFVAAGAALEGGGCVVRFGAERLEEAKAWLTLALDGLEGELGGTPFAA